MRMPPRLHPGSMLLMVLSGSVLRLSHAFRAPCLSRAGVAQLRHPRRGVATAASPHQDRTGRPEPQPPHSIFADDSVTFAGLGVTSPVLRRRLQALGLARPTAVQAASFRAVAGGGDATIGAETGSGKTLAYLLPLLNEILESKQRDPDGLPPYDYARALVLVPNKELVQQVYRMAQPLAVGRPGEGEDGVDEDDKTTTVRLAVLPGGLNEPLDFRPFRESIGLGGDRPPVDIVLSTPASVGPLALKPKHVDFFADIRTVVVDEADMLLDGGYLRQLENVLMGFRRADRLAAANAIGDGADGGERPDDDDDDDDTSGADPFRLQRTQHVFVAATLPDSGLRSVDAYLSKRFPYATRVTMKGMHSARHYGLREKTAWHIMEEKKERLQHLIGLLNQPPEKGGLKGEKIMVFLNSVEDVDNVHEALKRAGIESLAYHAKLKLDERTQSLDRFRRYDNDNSHGDRDDDAVGVLVCTDLASRGIDVPGVDAVVQLQFAGNVVAHLHRMGRCGRAGHRNGRGIVYYGDKEQDLVRVVQIAEDEHERMSLEQDVDFEDVEDPETIGTVQRAFSRKRGFTKKRKKLRREDDA